MLKTLLLAAATLTSTVSWAESGTHRFYGYAYDLKTGRYLYTEVHEQKMEGEKWVSGKIDYYAADGSLLGKKTLDFSQDPYVPVFRLDLVKEGYMEAITRAAGPIELVKRSGKGKSEESARIKKQPMMVADSGFHSFLVTHFPALLSGQKMSFRFVVAGNLDAFKFVAQRVGDTKVEGRAAVRLVVKPDSMLSLLVDPLEVTYDIEQKKLVEYRGISNIHDPVTGKAYVARIIYPGTPPADAPRNLPPLN